MSSLSCRGTAVLAIVLLGGTETQQMAFEQSHGMVAAWYIMHHMMWRDVARYLAQC